MSARDTPGVPATADLRAFIDDVHEKIEGHATRKETEAFLELWSHTPDASIMAAVGGYRVGYDEVSKLLRWVSRRLTSGSYEVQTLTAQEDHDLAMSVELERLTDPADGRETTLRITHVYRREHGSWRLLHRHAEALIPVDEAHPETALSPSGGAA